MLICEKQVDSRFMVICHITRIIPNKNDLISFDKPLLSRISRVYGSFENYMKEKGNDLFNKKDVNSNEYYIAKLRCYYFKNRVIPEPKHIHCCRQILNIFGSWKSALIHSGFERIN